MSTPFSSSKYHQSVIFLLNMIMQVGKYEKMCHVLLMKGKANEKIPQKMFIIETKTTFEIVFLQNVSFWLDVAFPTLSYVSSLGQN